MMLGTPESPMFFEDGASWRRWLSRHRDRATEVWILAYKVHTGMKCMSYREALDEALCYGWIDCRVRRIDDQKHMWRFVPRRTDSIWSLSNRRRAEKLIADDRMTPWGLGKVEAAKRTGEWEKAIAPSKPPRIPEDLRSALMENKKAWRNFRAFARSYRTTYIYWVSVAKREETRKKRINEVVERAELNIKLGFAPIEKHEGSNQAVGDLDKG